MRGQTASFGPLPLSLSFAAVCSWGFVKEQTTFTETKGKQHE
jgi:hypothetical protein